MPAFVRCFRLGALLFGLGLSLAAYGFFPVTIERGEVVARSLAKGPSGQPIFAIYDDEGQLVSEIGEATGELENAFAL